MDYDTWAFIYLIGGLFGFMFIVGTIMIIWESIPCSRGGPHHWIELDRMAQPYPERDCNNSDLLLRVCEVCKTIQDDITPMREFQAKKKAEAETRKERGWQLLREQGHENFIPKANR